MTSQQIQLKIEYYLKHADRGLLDKLPLPGGRMRLLAANPESYLCNYAVAEQWLDIDETIEAAEEEFAGRGVSPCRFYGAPDSLSLDMLRPAFARHGYAVKELRGVRMLALARPVRQVPHHGYEYSWQSGPLDEEEQQLREQAGRVLQIDDHYAHIVPAGGLQPGVHGGLLAEIAGEGEVADMGVALRQAAQGEYGAVRGAVVHEDELPVHVLERGEHAVRLVVKQFYRLLLVVAGDYYRELLHLQASVRLISLSPRARRPCRTCPAG